MYLSFTANDHILQYQPEVSRNSSLVNICFYVSFASALLEIEHADYHQKFFLLTSTPYSVPKYVEPAHAAAQVCGGQTKKHRKNKKNVSGTNRSRLSTDRTTTTTAQQGRVMEQQKTLNFKTKTPVGLDGMHACQNERSTLYIYVYIYFQAYFFLHVCLDLPHESKQNKQHFVLHSIIRQQ